MQKENKKYTLLIITLSVVIPIVVALLLFKKDGNLLGNFDVSFLPHFNAILNATTALLLMCGFYFIKNKQRRWHATCMISAFVLSSIFLVSYVIYHSQAASTPFGGVGLIRGFYFFVLISHILLAAVMLPFVLFAMYYGISKQFQKHKKVTRWAFPIWLYVAVTGVIVYFMIAPYYS